MRRSLDCLFRPRMDPLPAESDGSAQSAGKGQVQVSGDVVKDRIHSIQKDRPFPVALVGSSQKRHQSLDIFKVLAELDLAQLVPRPELDQPKTKDKEKDKSKHPNQFKDKESGETYIIASRPSVIISITGDAGDLPDDDDLAHGVEDFLKFCKEDQDLHACFKLSREDAYSAFLANNIYKDDDINKEVTEVLKDDQSDFHRLKQQSDADYANKYLRLPNLTSGSKCLQISLLLQMRIHQLKSAFKDKESDNFKNFEYHFRFPSVRDMLLNVKEGIDKQLNCLKEGPFKFPHKKTPTFDIKTIQISGGANMPPPDGSGVANGRSVSVPAPSADIKQPTKR